ncbi:MAG: SPOR domain-containing protein [Fibrobacter sp.]|nr:SPOR domain-containing protein [Fibrobacter sp.]
MKKKQLLILSLIAFCLNCNPYFLSRKDRTPDVPVNTTEESAPPVRAEITKPAQLTFIDTLNQKREIRLSDADFKKNIKQPLQTAGTSSSVKYRIQLFVSSRVETLREQKREAEVRTNLPMYISYEAPYYKLLAGDFDVRSDAENSLKKIKKIGYSDAWIVSSRNTAAN